MVCLAHTQSIGLQVIFRHSFPVSVDSFGVHVVKVLMLSLSVGRMRWDGSFHRLFW